MGGEKEGETICNDATRGCFFFGVCRERSDCVTATSDVPPRGVRRRPATSCAVELANNSGRMKVTTPEYRKDDAKATRIRNPDMVMGDFSAHTTGPQQHKCV